jgi:choline dehydrogenase-like flavoprotein
MPPSREGDALAGARQPWAENAPSVDAEYDFIIIGSGPGGGTLAHALAPSGKKILILERGDYLPREKENWESEAVFVESRYQTKDVWKDKDGHDIHPGIHYYVGGNSKVYGAALFRLRERDFGELVHRGGISPAWPLQYADMAPYYDRAEQLYEVHGTHGIDPTEPPAGMPYPFPALEHEPRIQQLHDDLVREGLHPFPLPVGVRLLERNLRPLHESKCIRCSTCDGFPCLVDAKSDAQKICVEPALAFDNVTLRTNAKAVRLLTSESGREVTGVEIESESGPATLRAHVVIVACGAINSAVLLLRSACDKHPDGLANGSGVVGRNYMRHNNSATIAVSKEPNPTKFQKTLGLNDYYFGGPGWDYPLGHIQMLGKSDADQIKGEAPSWVPLRPDFAFDIIAKHGLDFWLTSEDLPRMENGVTLERDGTIRLSLTPNNMEAHERLKARLHEMLGAIGAHPTLLPRSLYLGKNIPIGGTAHQVGTVRFGTDPASSALDVDCKAHELDNLYVVDGSFFVSAGAVNPALTIMANALRVAEKIGERYA